MEARTLEHEDRAKAVTCEVAAGDSHSAPTNPRRLARHPLTPLDQHCIRRRVRGLSLEQLIVTEPSSDDTSTQIQLQQGGQTRYSTPELGPRRMTNVSAATHAS